MDGDREKILRMAARPGVVGRLLLAAGGTTALGLKRSQSAAAAVELLGGCSLDDDDEAIRPEEFLTEWRTRWKKSLTRPDEDLPLLVSNLAADASDPGFALMGAAMRCGWMLSRLRLGTRRCLTPKNASDE